MKHLFSLFAITLSTACGLTGCHLHKDYERDPSLLSLDSLRLSSTAVLGDSTMADTIVRSSVVCWERFYADSCLRLLIREGLAHNSDLRTAQLRTEEAMASLSAAKKALLPSADFVANGAVSSFDGGKATKTYSIGAEISWEADIFRRLTAAKRREAAAVEEKMCYEQAVRSQLIATIACHYFSLAALDRKVEISEEHIGSQEEYVRTLEALLSAGQSDRPTIRQAEAALLSARAQLAKQKLQLTETENSLLTLLGRQGGSIRRSALSDLCIPTFWEKGVRVDLLAARPDVREAEARLKQAFHGEQIARANFYPSLTLSGTVGWTNNGGAGVSNPGAILLSAAAGVVQPLFRRGELKKELRVAQLQREEAAVAWKQTVLDAGAEVNNALAACQTARERCRLLSAQTLKLREIVEDTKAQMRFAEVNYLQVLLARQNLLSAQLEMVGEEYATLEALSTLFRAVGGGA